MILVTGGSGQVGGYVAQRLVELGQRVRVLSRTAQRPVPAGAEPATGDLDDADSLARALCGVEKAYLITTMRGSAAFVTAARRAGVRHIVLVSARTVGETTAADPFYRNALFHKHMRGETAVRGSGIPWTILRPGPFASGALRWAATIRRQAVAHARFPDLSIPVVDPRDVGDAAVAALVEDGHEGHSHPLSGPGPIDPTEQVRIIGELTRRTLRLHKVSYGEAIRLMSQRVPAGYAEAMLGVEENFLHHPIEPTPLDGVCGRPGRTFRVWAADHLDAFLPAT